jgi:hypothetical protein
MSWIQTASGLRVNPFDYRLEDVNHLDIAYALSNLCRFNGHCRPFYSVAQHSVLVSRMLQSEGHDAATCLWGLLHDAAEAYLGDVSRPVKQSALYRYNGETVSCATAERRILAIIALNLDLPLPIPKCVGVADGRMLATEAHRLMGDCDGWPLEHEPSDVIFSAWSPEESESAFLTEFSGLLRAHSKTDMDALVEAARSCV